LPRWAKASARMLILLDIGLLMTEQHEGLVSKPGLA
jgi:hypothetical protein